MLRLSRFGWLLLSASLASNAFAADSMVSQSAKSLPANLRMLHVFHYGTALKSPLGKRGKPQVSQFDWTQPFTLTPQQPAVITSSQSIWPPGSLSAFGASQWYGQGYAPNWWGGEISLTGPSASLYLLLLTKAGNTYLIDENVVATTPGQFTITGPDNSTQTFSATNPSPDTCAASTHQQLAVIYQASQDGAVNFELQFAGANEPSTGAFCSVTVSIIP